MKTFYTINSACEELGCTVYALRKTMTKLGILAGVRGNMVKAAIITRDQLEIIKHYRSKNNTPKKYKKTRVTLPVFKGEK